MNLTQFAIEKNRITWMVLFTIIALGIALYSGLARDSMPPYTVRTAQVITQFPGASPERVELLVTDKIEKVAQELPELKEVSSTSRTGLSIVAVKLKDEVDAADLQGIWDRLRRKLDGINDLPQNVSPRLDDDGIGDVYGIVVGLTSDGFSYSEMKEVADELKDDLIKLPDAAKVELGGVQDERIFVEFNNAVLNEFGLTSTKLQNIIGSQNILSSGGQINLDDERLILEPTGNYDELIDLNNTLIPVGDGSQLVNLGDITQISKGYVDPTQSLVSVNGRPAKSLHINLKDGANIIQLGEDVDLVLEKWRAELPVGLEVSRLASLDTYIDNKISDFVVNLIQAIVIVFAVMLIFLGFRTGSIIASLIPIVTVMTLMLMGILSVGLNQVTLAALIMALGMMVDNAIVVAETIMVKMENGIKAKQAAIEASSELIIPLLISTLTTSAAFLSFYLAESIMGDIVGPIFVVITIALLSSWFIALTIITMFCALFMNTKKKGESKPSLIDRSIRWLRYHYNRLIKVSLKHTTFVMATIIVVFAASMYAFLQVPFLFFPDSDRNMITVDINLPLGTRIEKTEEIVDRIDAYIDRELKVQDDRQAGITSWSSFVGKGPASYDQGYRQDEANSSYAHILVNTSSSEFNNDIIRQLDEYSFLNFPDADIKVSSLAAGGGGTPIEIKVSGEDPDVLADISTSIKERLSSSTGTKNVKDDWGPKSKKLVIDIDQARSQAAGITNQDIATSLTTLLDGFATGEFREDDKSIPILLRSEGSQQITLENLETTSVFGQTNNRSVPLIQVASIIPQWQYAKIKRTNIDRTINVSSELNEFGNASAITSEITPWLDQESKSWPGGYTYTLGGDAESTAENMGAVIQYLPLSGFIIILLLIIQFNSARKTLMVLCTIPLATIGVSIGLTVFNEPFGFMPFLGVISLAGIIINNAIVLIDRIEIENTDMGRTIHDAVVSACLQRFRPIVLATLTTVLGLVPLYLSGGEMWEGMAVSIMVGLLFGTVITLVFIPTFYSILYQVNYKNYTFDDSLVDA